jgi:predicted transcriptional regulator
MQNGTVKKTNNIMLLLAIGGIIIIAFGLCSACVSLGLFFDPGEGEAPYQIPWLLSFILLALPMIAGGIAALLFAWRRHQQGQEQALQDVVLGLANAHQGIVTATKLALNSSLSLNGAQDYLDGLAGRGICRLEINQDGTTYFVFESS